MGRSRRRFPVACWKAQRLSAARPTSETRPIPSHHGTTRCLSPFLQNALTPSPRLATFSGNRCANCRLDPYWNEICKLSLDLPRRLVARGSELWQLETQEEAAAFPVLLP